MHGEQAGCSISICGAGLLTPCSQFQLARTGLADRRKRLEYLYGIVHCVDGISDGAMRYRGHIEIGSALDARCHPGGSQDREQFRL